MHARTQVRTAQCEHKTHSYKDNSKHTKIPTVGNILNTTYTEFLYVFVILSTYYNFIVVNK